MHLLVNHSREAVQNRLVSALYKQDRFDELLQEDERRSIDDPSYFGWEGLAQAGCIEYLDAEEEETSMICMSPEDLENYKAMKAGQNIEDETKDDDLNRRLRTKLNPTTHMYTHCEIHPSMLLGICASIIPFPDHNQVRCHPQ